MKATTLHALAVLFLATFIRSVLGFGEALVAVPLLALTMPVQVAAPLAVLVSITVAGVVVRKPELHSDRLAPLFGFAAGILGGAYGMNGPPLVVYGGLRRWQPTQFRAMLQGYFLIAILPGHAVHRRLSSARFLISVNVGLALIGALLLKQAFHA